MLLAAVLCEALNWILLNIYSMWCWWRVHGWWRQG